ncbi:MAG: pSer/pThr/pTyr-binding forkhead associated (FHA) protein [Cognaticolwellia sp.]|jgi:pSer/pThr/pTyr-binding forkhead associated (FHA) protein
MGLARIQLVNSNGESRPGQLGERVVVIGRAPVADIQVDDPTVSRLHAAAWAQNGVVFIKDLGGANGTFINGERLHGTVSIAPGTEVTLGRNTRLQVELGADAPPASQTDLEATIPEEPNRPSALAMTVSANTGRGVVSIRNTINLRETLIKGTRGATVLAVLAHALVEDRRAGKAPEAQGWRSDKSLGDEIWKGKTRSRNNLNVLLHRLRKTLLEQGVDPGCIQKESGMCRIWVEQVTLN